MFWHYLKIVFRNIGKHKPQFLVGVLGIALALACLVPSLYWIDYETSYDSFYPGSPHIYRVYTVEKQSGKVNKGASKVIERKLGERFAGIESSTTLMRGQENCRTAEVPHVKMQLLYADSSFLRVFPQKIISGERLEPLQVKNNMVLTESMAVRLFGSVEKAVGQPVWTKMRNDLPPYLVTAVVEDPSMHSNLGFDALVNHDMLQSFSNAPEEMQWMMLFMEVYVKFRPDAPVAAISEEALELPAELKAKADIQIRMMPLADVRHKLEANSPFTLNFIGLFVVSGVLLLVASVFNFFNLHFDLFWQRLRELNLRFVNGATTGQLRGQLIFELVCSVLAAVGVAACLLALLLPEFSRLLDISLAASVWKLFGLCGIGILILVCAVGYVLSWKLVRTAVSPYSKQHRYQPVYKRIAVSLQLFVSIVFIIASLVVMRQMNYVNQKDLGFESNDLLQLTGFVDYAGTLETKLINELKSVPQITAVSDADFEPSHEADPNYLINQVSWEGAPAEVPLFRLIFADSHFAEAYGLTMVDGDWWAEGQTEKVVLNEEAVRRMNISNPVGKIIRMPSESNRTVMADYEIAGVVKDFHTLSFRNQIQAEIYLPSAFYQFNKLYIRTEPGQLMPAMARIKEILPTVDSGLTDVRLVPVRDLYDQLNRSEQIGLEVFSALSVVCLLIALFGIYAVALASTERRRKEIAVRKVMGAEAKDIVSIFFREYVLQVVLAGAFALPVAYLAMSNWLQDYAYRTNIPVGLLLGVIVAIVFLMIATVLGQILRAANRNPAEELKRE